MAKTTHTPNVPLNLQTAYDEVIARPGATPTNATAIRTRSGYALTGTITYAVALDPIHQAAYDLTIQRKTAQWDAYVVEQKAKWGPSIEVKRQHYQQWLEASAFVHPQPPADRISKRLPRGPTANREERQSARGARTEEKPYQPARQPANVGTPGLRPLFPNWFMNLLVHSPGYGRTIRPTTPKTKPPRRNPAGTKINQSALVAAQWLALHFPKDAADEGFANFVAARKTEILQRNWNPKYWEQATPLPRLVELSEPTSILDPVQDIPGWYDSTRQRSRPTYAAAATPYPEPAPGAPYPKPSPGYRGSVAGNIFYDNWLAVLLEDFQLPRTYRWDDRVPVFADAEATWHVMTNRRPTQLQFSTYHRPVFQHPDDPDANDPAPIVSYGRLYIHTHPLPAGGPTNYDQTLTRPYLLDCNLSAAFYSGGTDEAHRLRLKTTVAAAMGRYFADSDSVAVDFTATSTVYMAKHRDENQPSAPPRFNMQTGQNPINPTPRDCPTGTAQWCVWKFSRVPDLQQPWLEHFATITLASDANNSTITIPGISGTIPASYPIVSNTDPNILVTKQDCLESPPLVIDPIAGNHYETHWAFAWLNHNGIWRQAPGKITPEQWAQRYIAEAEEWPAS